MNKLILIFAACMLLTACQEDEAMDLPVIPEQPEEGVEPEEPETTVPDMESLIERVSVQDEIAEPHQIIDGQWVAVGITRDYALMRNNVVRYKDQPSYQFTLLEGDNSLDGYNDGESKGRAEISYCYATADDYKGVEAGMYEKEKLVKNVYHRGKGYCEQGSRMRYRFAMHVPDTISEQVQTIFAQWHGMPTRTLATTPAGEVVELTYDEFIAMADTTIFDGDTGYQKIVEVKPNGDIRYKKGEKTGWLIEQGGYPPLAFGFNSGFFYIKSNSDARWFTDKTDRTNANVERFQIMQQVKSEYKVSTIVYKMPMSDFPKNEWVEFDIEILWSAYSPEQQVITQMGMMDVMMTSPSLTQHIVKQQPLEIGRNDDAGYYFKMGIYRTASNLEPTAYQMAGYEEEVLN